MQIVAALYCAGYNNKKKRTCSVKNQNFSDIFDSS